MKLTHHQLMLGAVAVILGYALYQHFKKAPALPGKPDSSPMDDYFTNGA